MHLRRLAFIAALPFVAATIGLMPARAATPRAATFPASSRRVAPVAHRPIISVGASQSSNWSGYNQGALEKSTTFHGVAGDWVVPTASEHKANEAEYSSSWVGIGGGCLDTSCTAGDNTLIQAGTEQDAGPTGGPLYYAWWEIIPAPSLVITDSSNNPLPVSPGDHMHVDITQSAPQVWTINVKDLSRAWTFTQTVPYTSSYATAEWIEETPVIVDNSGNVSIGPLPKLTTVHFDSAQTTSTPGGTLSAAGLVSAEEVQLVDSSGAPLATPSAPDTTKDGFNDCAYSASCPTPTSSLSTTTSHGTKHAK